MFARTAIAPPFAAMAAGRIPNTHDSDMAEARPDSLTRSRAAKPAGEGAAFSPLYRQIKELLVQSLDRGEWKPGELIPSEIDLAARFQVSQGTVRKAVDELAAEHLPLRRQGKGTFVATHHEARVRYRFLRLAPDEEGEGGRAESRILECRRLRAPAEIARALELRAGETVVTIRRQLSMNHMPTVIDDLWLPGTHFRGLTLELLTASKAPCMDCSSPNSGSVWSEPTKNCAPSPPRLKSLRSWVSSPAGPCCRSIAFHIPMAIGPWKCAAAYTLPIITTTAIA